MGRPKRHEAPAPSRKRTLLVPLEMDEELVKVAEAKGLSVHAALREAVALWLETNRPKG